AGLAKIAVRLRPLQQKMSVSFHCLLVGLLASAVRISAGASQSDRCETVLTQVNRCGARWPISSFGSSGSDNALLLTGEPITPAQRFIEVTGPILRQI